MAERRGGFIGRFLGLVLGVLLGLALGAGLLWYVQPQTARSLALAAIVRAEQLTGLKLAGHAADGGRITYSGWTTPLFGDGSSSASATAGNGGSAVSAAPPAEPVDRPDPATLVGTRHSYSELVRRLDNAAKVGFKEVSDTRDGDHAVVVQQFRFQGVRRSVSFKVRKSDLRWAQGRELADVMDPGETKRQFESRLWKQAVNDTHMQGLYKSMASSLRRTRDRLGLSADEYAELITAYVQQMPYDQAAARAGAQTKYPIVTAVDGRGVCGDKSLLLAALLQYEGYHVALLQFDPESHMAVGIRVPGAGYKDTGYAFVESTAPSLVGEVGQGYGPGGRVKLTSDPVVTELAPSGARYGSLGQTEWIAGRVKEFQKAYDGYKAELPGLRGDVPKYNAVVAKLNRAARIINTTIDHPDDREALYSWLKAKTDL